MTSSPSPSGPTRPAGCITFTINAHLPWVLHHGTWPHGMEWLLEAAAETYLPLLRLFARLHRDSIPLGCNLILSPVLLEQLAHPLFRAEFPRYLQRKIDAAREDESYFVTTSSPRLASLAQHWQVVYTRLLAEFQSLSGDLIAAFRFYQEQGVVDLLTTAATYAYLPLLSTDESLRAQIKTAIAAHTRHFGRSPRGFWLPECGYRPASAHRIGIEQILAENGIQFFFADTHMVADSSRRAAQPIDIELESLQSQPARSLYQPYLVDGEYLAVHPAVAVFARDPHTANALWSSDTGYSTHPASLSFHQKRWPGGHRYWRREISDGQPQPYDPAAAASAASLSDEFLALVAQTLSPILNTTAPPILTVLMDADILGRWWHEGTLWLEAVAHAFAHQAALPSTENLIAPITAAEYLRRYPSAGHLSVAEGSWGSHGNHHAWLNSDTAFTWEAIHAAEISLRTLTRSSHPLAARLEAQLRREFLLLQSSDWQFLITTGAAREYATTRFTAHHNRFRQLLDLCQTSFIAGSDSVAQAEKILEELEHTDGIFPAPAD